MIPNRTKTIGAFFLILIGITGSIVAVQALPAYSERLKTYGVESTPWLQGKIQTWEQFFFLCKGKARLSSAQGRAAPFWPRIVEIFQEEGVPPELARVAFIESMFNPHAVSKAGAVGVWQMMLPTAKFHLRVDEGIDERRDPLKGARAAAKLFASLHKVLGSWGLAVMAYHQGEVLVKKGMDQTRSKNPAVISEKFEHPAFQNASRNYLPEWLALLRLEFDPKKMPTPFVTVSAPRALKVLEIKQKALISLATLKELNPHFKEAIWSGKSLIPAHYPIRVRGVEVQDWNRWFR